MVANLVQIVGATTIALGAGLIYPPAGVMLAGAFVLIFGLALERE